MALELIRRRLGTDVLDIHAGGVDLIFPHHEDEIAQSCAYTGQDAVRPGLAARRVPQHPRREDVQAVRQHHDRAGPAGGRRRSGRRPAADVPGALPAAARPDRRGARQRARGLPPAGRVPEPAARRRGSGRRRRRCWRGGRRGWSASWPRRSTTTSTPRAPSRRCSPSPRRATRRSMPGEAAGPRGDRRLASGRRRAGRDLGGAGGQGRHGRRRRGAGGPSSLETPPAGRTRRRSAPGPSGGRCGARTPRRRAISPRPTGSAGCSRRRGGRCGTTGTGRSRSCGRGAERQPPASAERRSRAPPCSSEIRAASTACDHRDPVDRPRIADSTRLEPPTRRRGAAARRIAPAVPPPGEPTPQGIGVRPALAGSPRRRRVPVRPGADRRWRFPPVLTVTVSSACSPNPARQLADPPPWKVMSRVRSPAASRWPSMVAISRSSR